MAKTVDEIREEEFRVQQLEAEERARRAELQDEQLQQIAMQNEASRAEVMESEAIHIADLVKGITAAAITHEASQKVISIADGNRVEWKDMKVGPATLLAEMHRASEAATNPTVNGLGPNLEARMDDVVSGRARQDSQMIYNDTPAAQPEDSRAPKMRSAPGM